jgi:hypothetical protein
MKSRLFPDRSASAGLSDAEASWRSEPLRVARRFWRGLLYGAVLSLLGWTLILTILFWVFW